MRKIVRIVSQGQIVNITKSDGTTIKKSMIVLQDLGGKYEDTYAAALLSPNIGQFQPNDVYAVSLRFQAHEYNGQVFQDVLLQDYCKLG